MNLNRLTLGVLAGTMALGVSSQANAYIYSVANMSIDDFTIAFQDSEGNNQNPTVNRFDFTLTNTASLDPNDGATAGGACGGTPGAGNNDCTQVLGSMDANAVNAPNSTTISRTNNQATSAGNEFTMFGPSGGDWSNSDSHIVTAELVDLGQPTSTRNVAESEINTEPKAKSESSITSITGFSITFTIPAATDITGMTLTFNADPELYAAIVNQADGTYSAQASLDTTFALSKDGTLGTGVSWAPTGTTANNCISGGGVTCIETADSQNLNTNVGTTSDGLANADSYSYDPNDLNQTAFGITIGNLTAGTWTLTLSETKKTSLGFTPTSVPEPGILALLAVSFFSLVGLKSRRRNSV